MRQTQNTQKNSNKKSIFIIALLLLLVAVIGFGGYTLSKYVSSKNDNGTANVAKWGFTVTANGDGLFGADYKYDANEKASIVNTEDGATLTVSAASADSKLVAPGTKGSMTFTIAGTAEVKSQVAVSLTGNDVVLKYTTKTITDGTYNPVKWTLKKEGVTNALLSGGSFDDLVGALEDLGGYVDANASYANAGNYIIEWEWAFDGTANNADADKLDTLLGMVATKAGETRTQENALTNEGFTEVVATTKTTINFNLSVSVTQIKGD